jgi:hypothetical protein
MDILKSRPQFINTITEVISLWAPQLVAKLGQSFNSDYALVLDLGWQLIDPFQKRATLVFFFKK